MNWTVIFFNYTAFWNIDWSVSSPRGQVFINNYYYHSIAEFRTGDHSSTLTQTEKALMSLIQVRAILFHTFIFPLPLPLYYIILLEYCNIAAEFIVLYIEMGYCFQQR